MHLSIIELRNHWFSEWLVMTITISVQYKSKYNKLIQENVRKFSANLSGDNTLTLWCLVTPYGIIDLDQSTLF